MAKPEDGSHLLDYDANDNPLYEGWAIRKGADVATAVWKIKKYTWDTGIGGEQIMIKEQFAQNNELFDNIWNNRDTAGWWV